MTSQLKSGITQPTNYLILYMVMITGLVNSLIFTILNTLLVAVEINPLKSGIMKPIHYIIIYKLHSSIYYLISLLSIPQTHPLLY